jgi:two-component system catabolic regulation response regulator CreB
MLVLADERIHSQLYPDLSLVSGHLIIVATAEGLMRQLWEHAPDVIMLEAGVQQPSAASLCAQVRQYFQTALIVVEAGATTAERVAWLDAGADDVLALPDASPAVLSARCHALVRRVQRQQGRDPQALRLHALGLQLDIAGRRLYLTDGRPLELSAALTRFLAIFFCYGDALVPTELLSLHMFGNGAPRLPKRLYTLVKALNERTAGVQGPVPQLQLVRGFGYRLTLNGAGASNPEDPDAANVSDGQR